MATSRQIDIPDVSHQGMLVMVQQLADPEQLGLTVLNFANEPIAGTVRSEHLVPGSAVTDMFDDDRGGDGGRPVELPRRAPGARGHGAAGDSRTVARG